MHDFAVTDQHIVFFDCPVVLDVAGATDGQPLAQWQPDHGTRVGVLTRDGESERVRWFPVGNRWVSHVLNAYTEGDEVVVDYVHRPSFEFGRPLGVSSGPTLHRLVIDLARSDVSDEEFDPRPVEFPRIDDRRVGLRHRYGFFAALTRGDGRPEGIGFDTLVRCDLRVESTVEHRFPEGVLVGEPQFVPRPDSVVEGDGWILALTFDVLNDRSELVILDTEAFDSDPVATVRLPRRVPAGLHGTWIPGREPDAPRHRHHTV
jgi:carotenoid cleavage dioxygenase